jgi:hypothetical protein
MRVPDLQAGSESEAASDEASDGSFGETDEDDASGGPRMLVEPPSAPVDGRVWDARDETWSQQTRELYDTAWENINKPSWVVYPSHVKKVLTATVPLMQPGVVLRCARHAFGALHLAAACAAAAAAQQPPRRVLTRVPALYLQRPSGAVCARAGTRHVLQVL